MSETNDFRAELTKRGVEWMPCAWDPQTETFYKNEDGVAFIATESTTQDGFLLRTDMAVTTEQAIASTLGDADATRERHGGAGTCKAEETDVIKCWVKCKDEPSTEHVELIHVMECSACGGTYEHVNGGYEFCPRCGANVVTA